MFPHAEEPKYLVGSFMLRQGGHGQIKESGERKESPDADDGPIKP